MSELRNRPPFRLYTLALIPVLLSSCASWQAQSPPLAPHLEEGPEKVRLTLVDGRVVEMTDPQLRGDTIFGTATTEAGPGDTERVLLGEVTQLDLHGFEWWEEVLWGIGGGGALFAILAIVCATGDGCDFGSGLPESGLRF